MNWLMVLAMCVLFFLGAAADAQGLSDAKKLSLLNGAIAQQTNNVAAMKAELARNPNNPNADLLNNYYATASGSRTPAYDAADPYIKGLVDSFENHFFRNATGTVALLSGAARSRAFFVVEMDRSNQFIGELKVEKQKIEKRMASNPWQLAIGQWQRKGGWIYEFEISDNGSADLSTVKVPEAQLKDGAIGENDILFYGGKGSGAQITGTWEDRAWKVDKVVPPVRKVPCTLVYDQQNDTLAFKMTLCKYAPEDTKWDDQGLDHIIPGKWHLDAEYPMNEVMTRVR